MGNRLLLILLSSLFAPGCLPSQVRVASSVQEEIRIDPGISGARAILSVTRVETKLPNGQLIDGSLIGLYDSESHIFWWTHQSTNGPVDPASSLNEFLSAYKFSTYPDETVCFLAQGRTLWVRTSETRVVDLNQGIAQAIASLPAELAQFVSGNKMWFQQVPLSTAVGQAFFHPKNFGDPETVLVVSSAARSASGWQIEIDNDKGEKKTISLTRDFQTKSDN